MKRLIYILILIIFACDSESASDCFQTTGNIITETREVTAFSRILVEENVRMIIREGDNFEVLVEAGENLINDVETEVIEGQLILRDNNGCNLFREIATTLITVTAPNVTEIRSSTQFDIRSEGVLTFPDLVILSEDFRSEFLSTGNFFLNVRNNSIRVIFNNLSNCFIEGTTTNLNINFVSGNSRFEGEDLIAENITIFHRGTNDMLLFPTISIQGDIFSTGDVQLFNRPETVEVTEHFDGRLIFRN
ncbi:DUF2807 domain-containing protein [Flavobacteriaceae bacterium R38]|nr:DUF2807 domain-containing protein [Flavobacteriaceae bacterium R38]